MAEFEDKLNSILGNQEAMSQIMALARSLSGEQPQEPGSEDTYSPAETEPASPPADLSALMGQIDPKMLQVGMDVIRQVQSTEDRNVALLSALRPFLKEERRARLDRALKIARMTKLVRVALDALGERRGSVYNRYIPEDTSYARVEPLASTPRSAPASERRSRPNAISLPSFLTEKEGLSGIFKSLRLDRFDSGDILLLLIMLYLMAEGDDLELVIALGLTLIMGLGDSKKED